jgi:predicted peroxiredoxin
MTEREKVTIFCGSDTPEKAFPPFMLAMGADAMEMDVTLFFTMSGMNIVAKGEAEKIVFPGAPKTLPEFIRAAQEAGVKMIACSAAIPLMGYQEDSFIDGVEIAGIARFFEEALQSKVVLTF